jgi:two-component system, OmpR family, alkaline phosphatase synthesis response regulator PhoP
MSAATVLLVDDEPAILQLSRLYLERDGFQIQTCEDGAQALKIVAQINPALLVLDVMLPGLDGFEICRRLRAADNPVPIIMLTARDEDIDKILGLELGADDYLTKPFNPRELVARVKAILRRMDKPGTSDSAPLQLADLVIDPARREVTIGGRPAELRTQEFELLYFLAQNRGLVFSREKLLERAWGFDFYGQTRTVDVHVANCGAK